MYEKNHNNEKERHFKGEMYSYRNSDTKSTISTKLNEIYYYVYPIRIILKSQGSLESLSKYSGEEMATRKKVPQQNL
jgi:hypothetical protein